MARKRAVPLPVRLGLLLLVLLSALFSVYSFVEADWQNYINGLLDSNEVGGGVPTHAIVDEVVPEPFWKTGQQLDLLRVHYSLGTAGRSHLIFRHGPVVARHHPRMPRRSSIGRTLRTGEKIPIRFWGDGPETFRVDLPSETTRCESHARDLYIASLVSIFACVFCVWGLARTTTAS